MALAVRLEELWGTKGLHMAGLPPAFGALKNRFVSLIILPLFFFFSSHPHRVILEQNVSSAATVLVDK